MRKLFSVRASLMLLILMTVLFSYPQISQTENYFARNNRFDFLSIEGTKEQNQDMIQWQLEKKNKSHVIQWQIEKGYGLKKESYIAIYLIKPTVDTVRQSQRPWRKLRFSGKVSTQNKSYFVQVNPTTIPFAWFNQKKNILIKANILYCEFARGICYQTEKIIKLKR